MHVQQVGWSSGPIPLTTAASTSLHQQKQAQESVGFTLSGVSKDGSLGWQAFGSALEIFKLSDGHRVAAWCFGSLLKEPNTVITCLTECHSNNSTNLLIVATVAPDTQTSMVCLLDVGRSRVVKTFEMSYKVTSMEVLSSQISSHVLSPHLLFFCGVLAVGTHCGRLYLIDLCLDETGFGSSELNPSHVHCIDPHSRNIAHQRKQAQRENVTLALELGAESHNRGFFFYRKPDDSHVKTYSEDDIQISALHFMKHTGQLAVGFSFGCFQLWKLSVPVLEYSSRLEEDTAPVTHFAYQEPENDPRNFCYLWLGRGPMVDDNLEDYLSALSLFQLGFGQKKFYDGFGHQYEELSSVGLRFEQALTADPFNGSDADCAGSRILACSAIQDPFYTPSGNQNSMEESGIEGSAHHPDISRSYVMWEAVHGATDRVVHLLIFDINCWYHAEMPSGVRVVSDGLGLCPYIAAYAMQDAFHPSCALSAFISHQNIHRFSSPLLPTPESLFFPSSLTFDTCVVTSTGAVHVRFLGVQRQMLSALVSQGSSALLQPSKLYAVCVACGLIPRVSDCSPLDVPVAVQREGLLSMAIDHGLVTYTTSVASQWITSEFTGMGCTMRFFMDWALKKVVQVKNSVDKLCISLYDCSGLTLDSQNLRLLNHLGTTLDHMLALYKSLASKTSVTEEGHAELMNKVNVVQLLSEYTHMVVVFLNLGLLPELAVDSAGVVGSVFPAVALKETYENRRMKIKQLHSALKSEDVFIIDALMAREGHLIVDLWKSNNCDQVECFPPRNFHAVLNMYLVDGVPTEVKNFVTFYLLSDLLALAQDEETQTKMNERLQHFSQACRLATSTNKVIQGMWLLDHADFDDALASLLDSSVHSEISPWQHTCIVKAFLYQGHANLALKYLRVVSPPMATAEDVKLRLTVLLANGLTSEAFDYQRKCRDVVNAKDLLSHLVLASRQMRTLDQLLHLPFTETEERHLISYLRDSNEALSQELLVVYFLQRARFIEAVQQNAKLKLSGDLDPKFRDRSKARNSIVEGYLRVLPAAQRKLALGQGIKQKRQQIARHYARPIPLSTCVIRASAAKSMSRATLVSTLMDKVQEVEKEEVEEEEVVVEATPGPFVCTPIINRTRESVQDNSAVVYPCIEETSRLANFASPHRRNTSRISQSFNKSYLQKLNDSVTSEMKSLLCTPPVRRRRPLTSKMEATQTHESQPTPTSILKVKQSEESTTPLLGIAKLKSAEDFAWPTPPVTGRMSAGMKAFMSLRLPPVVTKTPVVEEEKKAETGTPKQLRFAMEEEEDEDAKEEEDVKEEESQEEKMEEDTDGEENEEERAATEDEEENPGTSAADLIFSPGAMRALRGSVLLETIRLRQSCSPNKTQVEMFQGSPPKKNLDSDLEVEADVVVDDDITFHFAVDLDHAKTPLTEEEEKEFNLVMDVSEDEEEKGSKDEKIQEGSKEEGIEEGGQLVMEAVQIGEDPVEAEEMLHTQEVLLQEKLLKEEKLIQEEVPSLEVLQKVPLEEEVLFEEEVLLEQEVLEEEVPLEQEVQEEDVPLEQEVQEEEVSLEQEVLEEEVPLEQEVQEEDVPVEQEVLEEEVPLEQEVQEEDVPLEQEVQEEEVPLEQEVQEEDVPLEQEVQEEDVPLEQEVLEEEVPLEQEVQEEDVPLEQEVLEEEVPLEQEVLEEDVPLEQEVLGEDVPLEQEVLEVVPLEQEVLEEDVPLEQEVLEEEVPLEQEVLKEEVLDQEVLLEDQKVDEVEEEVLCKEEKAAQLEENEVEEKPVVMSEKVGEEEKCLEETEEEIIEEGATKPDETMIQEKAALEKGDGMTMSHLEKERIVDGEEEIRSDKMETIIEEAEQESSIPSVEENVESEEQRIVELPMTPPTRMVSQPEYASPLTSVWKQKRLTRSMGRVTKLESPARISSLALKQRSARKVVQLLLPYVQQDDGSSVLRSRKKRCIPQTPLDVASDLVATPPPAPKMRRRTSHLIRTPSISSEAESVSLQPSGFPDEDFVDASKFTFSAPMIVEEQPEDEQSAEKTPVRPFIFSPPVTRSASHRKSLALTPVKTPLHQSTASPLIKAVHRHSLGGNNTPQSPSVKRKTPLVTTESPARNTRSAIKRLEQVRRDSLSVTPTDSPISFLAPVEEEAPVASKVTRGRGVKKSYNSRTRRKTLKW